MGVHISTHKSNVVQPITIQAKEVNPSAKPSLKRGQSVSKMDDSRQSRNSISMSSNLSNTNKKYNKLKRQEQLITKIMMPLYYTEDKLLKEDIMSARFGWEMILNNYSAEFHIKRATLPYANCKEWFEAMFYVRLFDIHPFCKKMFSNPSSQGKFLTAVFSFVFTAIDDEARFIDRLTELARDHHAKSVKSTEYAFIGEVMFWTLRLCLGAAYSSKMHDAWVKLFSKMLSIMVPVAVACELQNNEKQKKRVEAFIYDLSESEKSHVDDNPEGTEINSNSNSKTLCPYNPSKSKKPGLLRQIGTTIKRSIPVVVRDRIYIQLQTASAVLFVPYGDSSQRTRYFSTRR